MKAFFVECDMLRGITIVSSAGTAGQARYDQWSAAREAGYNLSFGDMRVKRAPAYDSMCRKKREVIGNIENDIFIDRHT